MVGERGVAQHSETAPVAEDRDAPVALGEGACYLDRVVRRAVVDEDEGEVGTRLRRQRLERARKVSRAPVHGVYAFDPDVRELIAPGEAVDFPDLLWRAVEAGHPVGTHRFEGYWRDIGNPDDYQQAIADFAEDPERFIGAARGASGGA